jgi:Putative auto-transporter adhesin, head GIN domain
MSIKSTLLALVLITSLSSCFHQYDIVANGHTITQVRSISNAVNTVKVEGSTKIEIRHDSAAYVQLQGSSNLIAMYETTVSGNTLTVHLNCISNIENDDVTIIVYLPDVEEASVEGSGGIHFNNITLQNLILNVAGSGTIDYYASTCDQLVAQVEGSGSIRMYVNQTLNGTVDGSGKIRYGGNPTVIKNIHGSGSIEHE